MADKQLENERQIIETYMQEHCLETTLNDVVNNIVKTRWSLDGTQKLGGGRTASPELRPMPRGETRTRRDPRSFRPAGRRRRSSSPRTEPTPYCS